MVGRAFQRQHADTQHGNGPGARDDLVVMALVAGAVLLYEIAITRVLSVVLWYHFAFLAVSVAMLGLGAPGVWYAVRASAQHPSRGVGEGRGGSPKRRDPIWGLLVAAGCAIPLSIILLITGIARLQLGRIEPFLKVTLVVATLLVPFLLLGAVVCQLLMRASGRGVGRMYGADLLGATAGAVLVVPLMHLLPTPVLLGAVGVLPLAAAILRSRRAGARAVARGGRRKVAVILPVAVAVAVVSLLFWGEPFALRYSKNYAEAALNPLVERWTPTARLTVFPGSIYQRDHRHAFGWGLGNRFSPRPVEQLWIDQDGSAGTPVTRLQARAGSQETVHEALDRLVHLFFDVTSIGYQLVHPRDVCIIGAGGGRDILTALKAGAERVDAVEINPAIIDLVSHEFGGFSGDPYHLPGVNACASEGRSFLVRTERRYDLLQISLIDSWAATTAGAYSLSENYLYTEESLRLYWNRLTPDGVLSISRWCSGSHQLEGARLVLLAAEALRQEGVADPLERMAVVQGGLVATLLVPRTPFDRATWEQFATICDERGFLRLWPAPDPAEPGVSESYLEFVNASLPTQVLRGGAGRLAANGVHLAPPTDDRPFFFQSIRPFSSVDLSGLGGESFNDSAARLPAFLVVLMSAVTLALFFAPFLFAGRLEREPHFWRGSGYFLAIGLGFMLVEAPVIQRFILYLGHPSYATAVVLAALLLGSGLGSLAAARVRFGLMLRLRWILPASVVAANLLLPALFDASLGWNLALRAAMSVLAMLPLGFVMGFAFPAGMMHVGQSNRAWYWAVNGAASVLAAVLALALAFYVGLAAVVWVGAACYLGACLLLARPATARCTIPAG